MRISRTAFAAAQAGVPVVFVGDYGIGKSSVAYAFAKFWLGSRGTGSGIVRLPVVGSVAEDFIGYPEIREETVGDKKIRMTFNVVHEKLRKLMEGDAVLLLEELNRADERIQNAIAQILDGELGQFGSHGQIITLATMNDAGRGIYELNENLISRMAFFRCEVNTIEERQAILSGSYRTESQFVVLPEDWRQNELLVRSWLASFYEHRMSAFRAPREIDLTSPWPNPRSRDKLAVPALAAAVSVEQTTPEDISDVLTATMGAGFATEFRTWFTSRDYPKPSDVLAQICAGGSPTFKGGPSAFIAVYGEILHLLNSMPLEEGREKMYKVLEYFGRISSEIPEAVAYMVYMYLSHKKLVKKIPSSLIRVVSMFEGR